MPNLNEIVDFCNERARTLEVKDFTGSYNGLQCANNGTITKIGAAVDAGTIPFQKAIDEGIDFLIVHHGMFWNGVKPIVESQYEKTKLLIENNLAVYSCHLPLDAHPEIGNNALLAKALDLQVEDSFLPYEGTDIGLIAKNSNTRDILKLKLDALFNGKFQAIEFGSKQPERIAILTGSGASAVDHIKAAGADTLITGELRQQHFNQAQEEGLNLYLCGHYATETFGVAALAREAASKFDLEYEWVGTECPL